MAEDVQPQAEGLATLHLRMLRKEWRVVTLQVMATLALFWLFLSLTQVFGHCHAVYEAGNRWCPALDHTLTLDAIEDYFAQEAGEEFRELPLPDWMVGQGNDGDGRYLMPMLLTMMIAGAWVALNFQPPQLRRRIMLGLLVGMILFLAGIFIITWLFGMLIRWDMYLPFGHADNAMNHANHLIWPLSVYIQVFVVALVLAPVIFGLMGIWGLSKRMINWSLAYILVYLGFYALFSYEGVVNMLGSASDPYVPGLDPLPTQVSASSGLIAPEIWSLLLIAMLMLVYTETSQAVIRFLEYAFRLPESCKKDPEYVKQFKNILNSHMQQTVVIIFAVTFVTMLALKFDELIIDIVGIFDSGQWSGQVGESLELRLTYGKVISAMMFLLFVAGLRFVVPWQRMLGLIETTIAKARSNP